MQTNPVDSAILDEPQLKVHKYGALHHLAGFAQYLIEQKLEEFTDASIKSLRELDVPLLKHMTIAEGDAVAAKSTLEMLTHLASNDPYVHIQKAIDRWTSNQLPKVEKNQIVVEDITRIAYSRKIMFLEFLPHYTSDPGQIIRIVGDIDQFILQYTSVTFQTFIGIVDERIQNHIDQLENSQRLFNQAQALGHIGNYIWDVATNVLLWSDELYRIYELDPAEVRITNKMAGAYNHPEDADYIRNCMDHARSKLQPFDFYYRIITKSGQVKTLHARGEIEGDAQGKVTKIFGTCQDVSVQKETESKLLQNQNFIKKIADAIPAIIASYNVQTGIYSFLSGGLKKLLGYDVQRGLEEGVGFFINILHPDDIQPLMQKNSEALNNANHQSPGSEEQIIEFQYRMKHASGEYRWFQTYGTVFSRDNRGQVDQVINISLDITEAVKSENILLQKTLELQQSNASLEEFAFVTSHDLKEPLRKISTFIDLLLSQGSDRSEKESRYLQKILGSAERMQQMIDNLLSLSLLTNRAIPERYELSVLLSEVLTLFEHHATLNTRIHADALPAARIVPSQFRQLFQNLISNSIKFARDGLPPEITITSRFITEAQLGPTHLRKAEQYLELVFADNGIGFEEAFSEKIFAIFQRLHHKEVYEGTGIGLAICKRVVHNHGGSIRAEGFPDQGAVFTILIPQ